MIEHFFTLPRWVAPAPYQHRRFGQRFLSQKCQDYMQLGARLINEAPLLFSPLSKDISKQHPEYESPNNFYWRLETSQSLQKPEYQQKLIDCAKTEANKEAMQTLLKDYQRHGHFAHFQSSALLHITEKIIPPLLKRVHTAQSQLNHWFFRLITPKAFFHAYQDHLFAVEYELKKVKHEIINAMLVRLKLAITSSSLQCDDVLLDFIYSCRVIAPHFIPEKQLRNDATRQFKRSLPQQPSQRLTKQCLLKMMHMILHYGTKTQTDKLTALLQTNDQLSTIHNNHGVLLTSTLIARRLHAIKRYPTWFHKAHTKLKKLCTEDNSFTLICSHILQEKLMRLASDPNNLEPLIKTDQGIHISIIKQLQTCHTFFEKHIHAVEQSGLTGLWRLLDRGKTNHALMDYKSYLVQNQLTLIQTCVQLLDALIKKLPADHAQLKPDHLVTIKQLLSLTLTSVDKVPHNEHCKATLRTIQNTLNTYLIKSTHAFMSHTQTSSSPTAISTVTIPTTRQSRMPHIDALLQKLSAEKALTRNDQAFMCYYLDNICLGLPSRLQALREQHKNTLAFAQNKFQLLANNIPQFIQHQTIKQTQFNYFLQLGLLMKKLGNSAEQQTLAESINTMLRTYLKKAATQYNTPLQIIYETMITTLGTSAQQQMIADLLPLKANKSQYLHACQTALERNTPQPAEHAPYFEKEMHKVDQVIFTHFATLSRPTLTPTQLAVFIKIRDKMIAHHASPVADYAYLSTHEKTLLGITHAKPSSTLSRKKQAIAIQRQHIISASVKLHQHFHAYTHHLANNTVTCEQSRQVLQQLITQVPELRDSLCHPSGNSLFYHIQPYVENTRTTLTP